MASGIVGSNNPNLAKLFAVSTSTNRVCGGDGMGRGVVGNTKNLDHTLHVDQQFNTNVQKSNQY